MAKAPSNDHAWAIKAFIAGRISKREYQLCLPHAAFRNNGVYAWISGASIITLDLFYGDGQRSKKTIRRFGGPNG